jgi:hypothetical protein
LNESAAGYAHRKLIFVRSKFGFKVIVYRATLVNSDAGYEQGIIYVSH